MDSIQLKKVAERLLLAERTKKPIAPLTTEFPAITLQDAYAIQNAVVSERVSAGARVVGYKVGLTSAAMQQMLGVNEPDYGPILDTMVLPNRSSLRLHDFIAPRVEAEIAFVLRTSLRGPGVEADEASRAIGKVIASLEIIDSRISDWRIKLPDTIADHASCARVVLSEDETRFDGFDLKAISVVLKRNGVPVAGGCGEAVLGDPVKALAWAANTLGEHDVTLEAGYVIMPGALHAAVTPSAGDRFEATFDQLGTVSVAFQ